MTPTVSVSSYSRIAIGPSDSKVKKVWLDTKLPLFPNFISMPFGTTRTRFQPHEMFSYHLDSIGGRNLLTVSRDPNPAHQNTVEYFYGDGWNIDLAISNIPSERVPVQSLFPAQYGEIDVESFDHVKCGIVVPIFGRCTYVEKFFASLRESDLTECLLILVDESLTKNIDSDKRRTQQLVRDFRHPNAAIIKVYKAEYGNMFDSIIAGLDCAAIFCETLMTIDSDTLHRKNWVTKSCDLLETYEENSLVTGFNTINTGRHSILEKRSGHCVKSSIGGCHMAFKTDTYYRSLRYAIMSHKWDTNIVNQHQGMILATMPSVIEHIGEISSVHRRERGGFDEALDFL
jgi:hypothetical protein